MASGNGVAGVGKDFWFVLRRERHSNQAMTERDLDRLLEGARRLSDAAPVAGFSGEVMAALGPQMRELWSRSTLMVLALVMGIAAVLAAVSVASREEPEPPVLTLYQGTGGRWLTPP
jgi:hypothetical protein